MEVSVQPTPRSLYRIRNIWWHPSNTPVGPLSLSGRLRRRGLLPLPGIEPLLLGPAARSLTIIPTELSGILRYHMLSACTLCYKKTKICRPTQHFNIISQYLTLLHVSVHMNHHQALLFITI
jgi:hypothetical protein